MGIMKISVSNKRRNSSAFVTYKFKWVKSFKAVSLELSLELETITLEYD